MKHRSIKSEIHSHTTFSDGELEPEALAERCAARGVEVWSLTDHDTCGGCGRAQAASQNLGITFIPGIEMSAYAGRSVHILGYGVDLSTGVIERYSERRIAMRRTRMQEMVDAISEAGHHVSLADVESVAGEGGLVRPHLAQALLNAGIATSIDDAFARFIGNDAPFYRESDWPTVPEAISIIHQAKGRAVLAHPGIYGLDDQIEAWVRAGLDGIECAHPRHSSDDEARYLNMAQKFELVATASSDFHGAGRVGADRFGTIYLGDDVVQWLQGS